MTTDWRTHDTEANRQRFADAQARLDDLDIGEAGYTHEQADADRKLADRYDRLVLQPAADEYQRQCERAEFEQHYPEPPDGARIEFEADHGVLYGAIRQDDPEHGGEAHWYLYGDGESWRWRELVFRFRFSMDDLTLLVALEAS